MGGMKIIEFNMTFIEIEKLYFFKEDLSSYVQNLKNLTSRFRNILPFTAKQLFSFTDNIGNFKNLKTYL